MRRLLELLFIPLTFIITFPLFPIACLVRLFSKKAAANIAYGLLKFMCSTILTIAGADIHVLANEYIPNRGEPAVFVGNHRSMLDILLLIKVIPYPVGFIAKKSLRKAPFLSWWMWLLGCLFLDRKSSRKALKTILQGVEQLKEGHHVGVFPEGTRNMTDQLLPFKKGSLKLAERSGSLIVPFALKGTDDVFEKNGFNVKPGKISLLFGQPFRYQDLSPNDQRNSGKYVEQLVEELYRQLD